MFGTLGWELASSLSYFGLLSSIRYNKNRGGMRLLKGEKGEVKAKENDAEHTIRGTYIHQLTLLVRGLSQQFNYQGAIQHWEHVTT